MERESFEDKQVAAFLNGHFISIKVDREERPDVDKIYMTFVQSMTGSGGWPLNILLTPDLKPFFGGTYFPPDPRPGRPSFLQLLQQISQLWLERHRDVVNSASDLQQRLEAAIAGSGAAANLVLTADTLQRAGMLFKEGFDPVHGGFGGAPKFPQPSIPAFLLRYAKRFADDEASRMVLKTCDAMAAGGIHDQLGGGFARYAVDAEWLVPHFEKMLYDNAAHAALPGRLSRQRRRASCRDRPRYFGLRPAGHDAPRRWFLLRRGRRQRRAGGKILLLDQGRTFPAAHAGRIQRGGKIFWHHGGRQLH